MAELNLSTDEPGVPWAALLGLAPHILWAGLLILFFVWVGPKEIRRALRSITKVSVAGVELEFRRTLEAAAEARGVVVPGHDADRVLRRLMEAQGSVDGARILWVDDVPENNAYEARILEQAGAHVVSAQTTEEALAKLRGRFDLVISDMNRHGDHEAGLRLAEHMALGGMDLPLIFYVGQAAPGAPAGAFGITDRPDELIHLVLDVLARVRG